jgi:chromosome segregation ATPase
LKRIEEYQESNKTWENKVNEINYLLNKLEESNRKINDENNHLRSKLTECEFQINHYREKEKNSESNFKELMNFQKEYEKLIGDLRKKKIDFEKKEVGYKEESAKLNVLVKQYEKNLNEVSGKNV